MQLATATDILNSLPMDVLPLMLLLPLGGAVVAYALGDRGARAVTLLVSAAELVLSVVLALAFDPSIAPSDPSAGMQYVWSVTVGRIRAGGSETDLQFLVGVDGISVVMVVLSNLVVFIAVLASHHIHEAQTMYYALLQTLMTGLLGVFMALDLIAFFVFWELVLIPMFFIIGRWGEEGCQHAAVKFFIYTHLGSVVMLVGFFVLYFVAEPHTFNMVALRNMGLPPEVQVGFALAVFMGAGVKLPVWPLHNWLPWAHVKAPTPGSVILAGILLKMGGYGFIRLGLWMVPDAFARLGIVFAALAVFTCVYAALTAMAQTDLKSMVAYTSINHMSWVLLGVAVAAVGMQLGLQSAASLAVQGAVFMMFSHGTIISVMFIMAGQLKYSAGTREIPEVRGLMERAPRLSRVLVVASLAAFGLPGFSGFVAEALVLFGSVNVYIWTALIAFGVFFTVGYLLWTLNRIVFSDPDPEAEVTDATAADLIAPVLMMVPVLLLGVWPDLVLTLVAPVAQFMLGG